MIKRGLRKVLVTSKKLIQSNRYSRRMARRVANAVLPHLLPNSEVYDHFLFYPTISDYRHQLNDDNIQNEGPLISIVLPTYNTPERYLRECIESVLVQSYQNWELCIADDASPHADVAKVVKEYAAKDRRIKFVTRSKNGHISAATNSGIDLAKGDYISLLDHDDVLWPNALYEVARVIVNNPKADFIYTDEDKIDEDSRIYSYPFFKPDWSPEFLESCNYITHFSTIRTSIVKKVGGLRVGYEGAQDWDLFLRVTEQTKQIIHIPKVLYSWRVHVDSTAQSTESKPYVYESQRKLLEEHITRMGHPGNVTVGLIPQHSYTCYASQTDPKKVRIVLRSDDKDSNRISAWLAVLPAIYRDQIIVSMKSKETVRACLKNAADEQSIELVICIDVDCLTPPNNKSWLDALLADAELPDVAFVSGRLVDTAQRLIVSAGLTMDDNGGLQQLLWKVAKADNHYMRILYGRSRRNVLALNQHIFSINKDALKLLLKEAESTKSTVPELCVQAVKNGLRNIYNPNLTFAMRKEVSLLPQSIKLSADLTKLFPSGDPYSNPNFSRQQANLEIKKWEELRD